MLIFGIAKGIYLLVYIQPKIYVLFSFRSSMFDKPMTETGSDDLGSSHQHISWV